MAACIPTGTAVVVRIAIARSVRPIVVMGMRSGTIPTSCDLVCVRAGMLDHRAWDRAGKGQKPSNDETERLPRGAGLGTMKERHWAERCHTENVHASDNSLLGARHQSWREGRKPRRLVLIALRVHAGSNDEARKCRGYVTTNRERMRYPEFRAQGLRTSTGVVEAGCKTAVGARLKRAGMHWTVTGANAIIALRCCVLPGRFEDFWERRAALAGAAA